MMIAKELVSEMIPPVKSSDTIEVAIEWMNEFRVGQLPIVDGGSYKGLITEDTILDTPEISVTIGSIASAYSGWDMVYTEEGNHIYDAIDLMSNFNLELLPVLGESNDFLGVITLRDLVRYLNQLFALKEPGGILVLEIPQYSYMLSEIGRIAESADAQVLSLYLTQLPQSRDMLLTLKLNVEDLSRVVSAYERFDYTVVRAYHRVQPTDGLRHNLDSLMRYLGT